MAPTAVGVPEGEAPADAVAVTVLLPVVETDVLTEDDVLGEDGGLVEDEALELGGAVVVVRPVAVGNEGPLVPAL